MSTTSLPRWDIETLYPGLASREYRSAREGVLADLGRLDALYDRHGVRGGEVREPDADDATALDEVLTGTNELLERIQTLEAYVAALVTTDAADDAAAAEAARLDVELVTLTRLRTRFDAWVGRLGADRLVPTGEAAADHAWALHRAADQAGHQMSEAEEDLAGDLALSGGAAWARMAQEMPARLTGTLDGRDVPVTVLRGLATDPDGAVRIRAYRAEIAAWESIAVPMAAALNGIKGEANTLGTRRGWPDSLGPSLHLNAVERPALEAMQSAMEASFPHFRRFLRAKSRLLGTGDAGLAWWDLVAPVPGEGAVSWDQASEAVVEAFTSFSPQLAGLARRALSEGWVDAEPREGKRGGAFCMPVRGSESRILLNFDGSWDSVQTLAHELGHAYHNTNLAPRTPLQRQTPMALAETASIFCETVMVQANLGRATDAERLALLNVDLQGACAVVVDIHARFLFERAVFEGRRRGPLSVAELCAATAAAQDATYGDGLAPGTGHTYLWAVKPHFYLPGLPYYNWPYAYGLLFGVGLYARFTEDPDRFRSGYDDLLASTGMSGAAELAARFGIDVADEAFWTASLDVLRGRIDDFVALVDAAPGLPGSPGDGG